MIVKLNNAPSRSSGSLMERARPFGSLQRAIAREGFFPGGRLSRAIPRLVTVRTADPGIVRENGGVTRGPSRRQLWSVHEERHHQIGTHGPHEVVHGVETGEVL